MNLLALLENGLFALGQVMRFPVMALLWICVASVFFMAGTALVEALKRRREREAFDIKRWLKDRPLLAGALADVEQLPAELKAFVARVQDQHLSSQLQSGGLEHLLLESEEKLRRRLDPSRLMVKVGPSLGLLGTLIPMGVSLASMAAGDLEAMAGQMVVAFTTTIIGLACGTAAYVINLVRQSWVNQSIREHRFVAERALTELGE